MASQMRARQWADELLRYNFAESRAEPRLSVSATRYRDASNHALRRARTDGMFCLRACCDATTCVQLKQAVASCRPSIHGKGLCWHFQAMCWTGAPHCRDKVQCPGWADRAASSGPLQYHDRSRLLCSQAVPLQDMVVPKNRHWHGSGIRCRGSPAVPSLGTYRRSPAQLPVLGKDVAGSLAGACACQAVILCDLLGINALHKVHPM